MRGKHNSDLHDAVNRIKISLNTWCHVTPVSKIIFKHTTKGSFVFHLAWRLVKATVIELSSCCYIRRRVVCVEITCFAQYHDSGPVTGLSFRLLVLAGCWNATRHFVWFSWTHPFHILQAFMESRHIEAPTLWNRFHGRQQFSLYQNQTRDGKHCFFFFEQPLRH